MKSVVLVSKRECRQLWLQLVIEEESAFRNVKEILSRKMVPRGKANVSIS